MEHNQYLNEILYLIKKYHEDNKIQNDDLQKISQLSFELTDNQFTEKGNKSGLETWSAYLTENSSSVSGIVIKIPPSDAEDYRVKFNKYFSQHTKLNKMFRVKSTFFNDSLAPEFKKNIVLQLVEHNGEFELAYLDNKGGAILVNENATKLDKVKLDKAIENFDKAGGIGSDLDENFRTNTTVTDHGNTRKITIKYESNFDDPSDFTLDPTTNITFLPAIISNVFAPNYHQFTVIMFFDNKPTILSKPNTIIVNETHYDTFQLCPPC